MDYKVLSRKDTVDFFCNIIDSGNRLVFSRYNDGEYLLMNGMTIPSECNHDIVNALLMYSLKCKDNIVCTNEKPDKKGIWLDTHKCIISSAMRKLYGQSNCLIYDYQNECKLLPKLFDSNRGLAIVSGIEPVGIRCKWIQTPLHNVSEKITELEAKLQELNGFDGTIIFSCGPVGKYLISYMLNKCYADLIDAGSLLNAILAGMGNRDLINRWPMSWAHRCDLKACTNKLLRKINNAIS